MMCVKMNHQLLHVASLAFIVFLSCAKVGADNVNITIPLNKTITGINKELYGEFLTIDNTSTIKINLSNINKKIDYIIFQVHSHIYNVTLYKNYLVRSNSISGTNVGLYGLVKPPDTYYIVNNNEISLKLYMSVHGYSNADPIPGGCNLVYPIEISPFMQVQYTKDIITVDVAPPKYPKDKRCNQGLVVTYPVKFYRIYLNERDFTEDAYFDGIKKMITMDKILQYGEEIPKAVTSKYSYVRRLLSTYPGTGSIYVAVAASNNNSIYSVYVPSHTYGCSALDGCPIVDDTLTDIYCAGLLFVGLFICLVGHGFFKVQMFLVGFFSGVIVTYIAIQFWTVLELSLLLSASAVSGIFFGGIWVLFWWYYGIPLLSVLLHTFQFGFVVSAIIYYGMPGGHVLIESDASFWSFFIFVILLTSFTLSTITYVANLLCCAVIGGYLTIFALDRYMGSNVRYIVINVARRATVENFGKVVVSPPFQWKDVLVTLTWVLLAVMGYLLQYYRMLGRPPFPPPDRRITTTPEPRNYGAVRNRRPRSARIESSYIASETSPLIS